MILLNFAFVMLTICMMDLEKIVVLGERLGLEGEKLQEFVAFRDKMKTERLLGRMYRDILLVCGIFVQNMVKPFL